MVGRGLSIGDPKKKWRQPAADPQTTAAVEPAPVADPYGYIQPPASTSGFGGFMDQLKYINRVNPAAFMQLGAGIMANDVAGGFANAGQEMQQGQVLQQRAKEKLYGWQEEQKSKNLTRQWLRSRFPEASETDLDAMIANPAVMQEMLAPPAKRNLITVGDRIYDADTDTWITPGAAGGFDLGDSLEARALEYLVQQKQLTEIGAADVAAGKQVTAADGSIWFKRASDLVRKTPDGKEEVVSSDATAPATTEGGVQITDPKPVVGSEGERRAQLLYEPTRRQAKIALDNYDALSSKMALAARIGEKLPGGIGTIVKTVGDFATTAEYQKARNAIKTVYTNWLYATSGATATPSEQETQADLLMPRPGEDAASIEGKKQQIRDYEEGIRKAQGVLAEKPGSVRPKPAAIPQATWDAMTEEERAKF